jgi:hypothetical protein
MTLLFVNVDYRSVDGAFSCLDTFCAASGVVVSAHKIDYWIIGLDTPPKWIPTTWSHIRPEVILKYLGILFGVGLSLVAMWDWCL